jgi:hypothetical protein
MASILRVAVSELAVVGIVCAFVQDVTGAGVVVVVEEGVAPPKLP